MRFNDMTQSRQVFGKVEEVVLPEWGISAMAKIDTGAYSGALHVAEMYTEKKSGEAYQLVFRPLASNNKEVRTGDYMVRKVKNTSGQWTSRYMVPVTLVIKDHTYHTIISLTDRSDMSYPIILGRRLLRENNIVVDVTLNTSFNSKGRTK